MNENLKSKAILKLVRQFVPDIRDKAAPLVEQFLSDIIEDNEKDLQLGECYAAIEFIKLNGCVYVRVVMMSDQNQVVRVVDIKKVDGLVNMLIDKLLGKEE